MIRSIQTKLHPARYQGHGRRPPYFEGWYYKLVDAAEAHVYAIIPGVFLSDDAQEAHAFVQIFDGRGGHNTYHRYPRHAFEASREDFEVHIGPNRFTKEGLFLQIDVPERTVLGELHFADLTPWPATLLSPGIMGWYTWVPLMECYHGVISLDHGIEGALKIDGRPIDFGEGRGYIEKDWGQSFPAAWIWMQSNHFEQPGTSLTASIAVIPWLGSSFAGQIIGLWHEGALYRFATYTGARVEALAVDDDDVHWVVGDKHHRLEIRAQRSEGGILAGPTGADMGGRVPETLKASIEVGLTRRDGQKLFHGTGRHAGLEVAGDLERLLEMV